MRSQAKRYEDMRVQMAMERERMQRDVYVLQESMLREKNEMAMAIERERQELIARARRN